MPSLPRLSEVGFLIFIVPMRIQKSLAIERAVPQTWEYLTESFHQLSFTTFASVLTSRYSWNAVATIYLWMCFSFHLLFHILFLEYNLSPWVLKYSCKITVSAVLIPFFLHWIGHGCWSRWILLFYRKKIIFAIPHISD